ncbi:MAG: hypothetical protein KKC37_02845 [Proteobacteria bacterium]|nr:hypothetical protein [Pseudomonadota bacterium]
MGRVLRLFVPDGVVNMLGDAGSKIGRVYGVYDEAAGVDIPAGWRPGGPPLLIYPASRRHRTVALGPGP